MALNSSTKHNYIRKQPNPVNQCEWCVVSLTQSMINQMRNNTDNPLQYNTIHMVCLQDML